MNKTYGELLTAHDIEVPRHLEEQAEIPVITGLPQAQGDVYVDPIRRSAKPGTQVPPEGVAVVRGEAGGHTHLLVAIGSVTWAPVQSRDGLDLGVVTVGAGSVAYLLHEEHGASGLGEGTYALGRQRQQADEIRRVED